MDINAAIDRAIALHQGGDLGGAEALYRQILIEAPALAGIHYLLGMAVLGQGRAADAVKALRTAVRLKPGVAEWSLNLGIALRRTGETTAALATLRAAAPLCAGAPVLQAEVLSETGALLLALGQDAEAELALRAALSLAPGHALARDNLAALLFNRFAGAGALDRSDAPSALAEAVQLAPQRTAAWFRLGQALLRAEQPQSALEAFDKGLGQNPQDQNLILGRSDALSVLGRFEEARDAAIKAAALAPATLGPPVALAVASHGLGMLSAAAAALRGVLAVDPAHVPALLNLGNVLNDLGDDAGAEECYRQVLSHEPGLPVAHWQRAQARLRAGDMEEGWREYEWRWRMPGFVVPSAVRALPVWDGGAAPEGRLLIHAEQGHGDSLQFIRYVPLLRDRGMDIHVQVQPALVRLFRESLPDDIGVGALGDPVPAGTVLRCPLLGLPLRLGTRSLAVIPGDTPYLHVPDARRLAWRGRLRDLPGLRVGLVWAGDGRAGDPRAAATDRRRSLALSQLSALAAVQGISLVSLQKGPKAVEIADSALDITDWTDELSDFADTAALVAELDLVIGVDTAVIHLAGGLGRPTWVLSRFDGCWRWLRQRPDNPWYPSLRIFRQSVWGDWEPTIAELVIAIGEWVGTRAGKVE